MLGNTTFDFHQNVAAANKNSLPPFFTASIYSWHKLALVEMVCYAEHFFARNIFAEHKTTASFYSKPLVETGL